MLPIPENSLTLLMLAKYWSRELDNVRTEAEILRELAKAVWIGELPVFFAVPTKKYTPRTLLESAWRSRKEHTGFVWWEYSGTGYLPSNANQPNKDVLSDSHLRVDLPKDPRRWTDEMVEKACAFLAELSMDTFALRFQRAFLMLSVTKRDLASYCDQYGYSRPKFWFAPTRTQRWTSRDEKRLKIWLRRISSGPKEKTKSAYFADAKKELPRLPKRAFDRAWQDIVPEDWKQPGPQIKSTQRDD